MKAGDTAYLTFAALDTGGLGTRYANSAAFTGAGGSVSYYKGNVLSTISYTLAPIEEGTTWAASTAYALNDRVIPLASPGDYFYVCTTAGTSDVSEPTWGTTEGGTTSDGTAVWTAYRVRGLHRAAFTAESGDQLFVINPPAGGQAIPDTWQGDVGVYDADSLASLTLTNVSTPGVLSGTSVDLGTITAGDAYRSEVLTIPEALAAQIYGVTDLTGYELTVAAKLAPDDANDIDLTDSAWVDPSARTFRVQWDTMPAAIVSALGTDDSLSLFIDVQTKTPTSTKPFTPNKYTATVVWDRNDN